MQLVAG